MIWEPLASETLGVRSMAFKVGRVVVDPSASLAPRRFGLPPHPREWEALREAAERIAKAVERSEAVVITHYHRDHYNPGWLYDYSLYDGKVLFIKDPKHNINVSQKIRAHKFLKALDGLNVRVEVADGRSFEEFGLELSPPLIHGSPKLGYVLAVKVGEVLYTSDVQGGDEAARRWIFSKEFSELIVDGPPIYLKSYELDGIMEILEKFPSAVVDHHPARERGWREALGVRRAYSDVLGVPERLLEARRRELYEEEPVEESWLKKGFSEMRREFMAQPP
ncbi:MAG: hypothetical protein GXO07_01870 [Crenarchaeota archaeon]|nr:hypothetical protein [Thermoproteota archaeon]